MQPIKTDIKIAPPRMIPSIVEGFNAITNHLYIILFPIMLDLLLWLGPLVSVKKYFLPRLLEALETAPAALGADAVSFLETTREMWVELLTRFNLLSSLRTFPIGVPSLVLNFLETSNPLGERRTIELVSGNSILGWTMLLLAAGFLLGTLYFILTANAINPSDPSGRSNIYSFGRKITQSLFLVLVLFGGIITVGIPVICLLSIAMLFLPALGTLPFLIVGMLSVWALMPLAFSPHGIFSDDLKATKSIVTSIRLVRSFMSPTGVFLMLLVLLGYGLDTLWVTPGTDNWMLMVGIIGHAFISAGLLASSFVYYKKGVVWLSSITLPKKQDENAAVS